MLTVGDGIVLRFGSIEILRLLEISNAMPYYVVLVNLLEGGRKDIQEGAKGRAQIMEQLQKAGGRSVGGYLTFGKYDAVEIVEAPNDDVMLRLAMMAPPGQVRTTTLKAFPFDQALKLVKK